MDHIHSQWELFLYFSLPASMIYISFVLAYIFREEIWAWMKSDFGIATAGAFLILVGVGSLIW